VYLKKYFFDIHVSANAVRIGKTIHPHPTLFDPIGMAVEVAHGSRTDLSPGKKQTLRAANKKASTREGWRL
jgi:hypothetical protein